MNTKDEMWNKHNTKLYRGCKLTSTSNTVGGNKKHCLQQWVIWLMAIGGDYFTSIQNWMPHLLHSTLLAPTSQDHRVQFVSQHIGIRTVCSPYIVPLKEIRRQLKTMPTYHSLHLVIMHTLLWVWHFHSCWLRTIYCHVIKLLNESTNSWGCTCLIEAKNMTNDDIKTNVYDILLYTTQCMYIYMHASKVFRSIIILV